MEIREKPFVLLIRVSGIMLLAGIMGMPFSAVAADPPPPGTGPVGSETCLACHDEIGAAFPQTPHGVYFSKNVDLVENSCEACHGSGAVHVEEGDPEAIINPAKHDQFGGRELCLTCHKGRQFGEWVFTDHNAAGLTCADCHTVHGSFSESTKKQTPQLCYDCHGDVRAATLMPSHHPIAEGKLGCQDCHAIHGGSGLLTMNNTGRELCFGCHADIEGPFVYEHAPVNEDCMICHTPHGSVANNLLKQSDPILCMNCHPMHFHTQSTGEEGEFTPPFAPEGSDRTSVSSVHAWKRGMLTKCTQCHAEIHGSDLPSQTIPTGGNALTR